MTKDIAFAKRISASTTIYCFMPNLFEAGGSLFG